MSKAFMDGTKQNKGNPAAKTSKADLKAGKKARLAAELRANLRRRKAKARALDKPAEGDDGAA